MNIPPTFIPAPRRVSRKRKQATSSNSPLAAPVLIGASWIGGTELSLQFDRAVDPTGLDPSQIIVDQGDADIRWRANGSIAIESASSIRLGMDKIGPASEPGMHLYATSANGIVSADGGEMWSGVEDLELPFS